MSSTGHLVFDVKSSSDPLGAALARLDYDHLLAGTSFRVTKLGTGSGTLVVPADLEEVGELHDEAFIQVKDLSLGNGSTPALGMLGGFFLGEGDVTVLRDGRDRRKMGWGGPGALSILERAALREDWSAPGQGGRGSTTIQEPGMWRWFRQAYGAILMRGVEEGQYEDGTPLEDVTIHTETGFEDYRIYDAAGEFWTELEEIWETETGTNILEMLSKFIKLGVVPQMSGELELFAYNLDFGTDRADDDFGAGVVRFEGGVNIASDLTRAIQGSARASHIIVRGSDAISTVVEDGAAVPKRYVTLDYPSSNEVAVLTAAGQKDREMRRLKTDVPKFPIPMGFDEDLGLYTPGWPGSDGHFWVGDTVRLHTAAGQHHYDEVDFPVAAITWTLQSARKWEVTLELGATYMDREARAFEHQVRNITQGASPPGLGLCRDGENVAGTGLIDFDWEEAPDYDETIPAYPVLDQAATVVAGAYSSPYGGRTSFASVNDPPDGGDITGSTYGYAPVTPGDVIDFSLYYLTFAHLSAPEVGAVWIQWLAGEYGSYTHVSNDYELLPRLGSAPVWKSFSKTVPATATTMKFYQGRETDEDRGWHIHGIVISEAGVQGGGSDCGPHDTVLQGEEAFHNDDCHGAASCNHAHAHGLLSGSQTDYHEADQVRVDSDPWSGTATNAQEAFEEIAAASAAAHIADTLDAHDASAISILDAANDFTATEVEGALAELQSDNEAHVVAADPHTGYQKESEKGAASGYASLGADTLVPQDQLGTGTQDGTKFLRDDGTWQAAPGGGSGIPASTVDAKGDLIVGTADDTVARKAAGANDTILMADSGQSDGLKWVASQTPSTQAFGDAAAEGTADTYSRGDHKHAIPADPVTAHAAASDPHTGYVKESEFGAKGDLLAGTASGTLDNLAAGTNGHSLVADSAETTGLKYAARLSTADHAAIDHGGIVGTGDWDTKVTADADQDVTNNATPQDSTEITIDIDEGVHEFQFAWIWSCSSSLAKARWRLNSSDAIQWDGRAAFGWQQSLSSAGASADPLGAIGASGGGTQWPAADQIDDLPGASDALDNRFVTTGRLTLVSPSGGSTITLQFGNNAAGASNVTRLHVGSYLWHRELAGAP